jgi:hypothetical protein
MENELGENSQSTHPKLRLSLYDFDGTIYHGDSLIDFWKYTIRKKPLGLLFVPYQLLVSSLYLMKLLSAKRLKENLLIQIILPGYALDSSHKFV